MPKYKLRLPPRGDYLYADGDYWFIGDTAEEAFEFFREEMCIEDVQWVHPVVLRGHVLYKRDIEAGDCHEDAEPGDTTFSIVKEKDSEAVLAHELSPCEVLAWVDGPVTPWWTYRPTSWGPNPSYEARVGDDLLCVLPSREAAEEAVQVERLKRIEAWKAAHPEFYRALPVEPEEADAEGRLPREPASDAR